MKKILYLLFVGALLGASCSLTPPENSPEAMTAIPSVQVDATPSGSDAAIQENEETPTFPSPTEGPLETLGPDCYGDETHPIGQSIADLYPDQTDYEEVMIWFCNGFEFEDILTALQTSEESDILAEELLAKFEHGQTWDEIWLELGLIEP